MNPEILNQEIQSPFDVGKKQKQEEMPVIVVHISKEEIKALDDLQGGASFDEETGVREYRKIGELFQSNPEIEEIFSTAGQDIADNGKLDNPIFKQIYNLAKKKLPDYQNSPADGNSLIEKEASLGEGGDTELVIFPIMLADIIDKIRGGTEYNSKTGLREYNFFKSLIRTAATVAGAVAGGYAGQPGLGAAAGNWAGRVATGQRMGSAILPAAKNYAYTMGAQGVAGLASNAMPGVAGNIAGWTGNTLGSGARDALGNVLNQGQGMGFFGNTEGSQKGFGGALGANYGGLGSLFGAGSSNAGGGGKASVASSMMSGGENQGSSGQSNQPSSGSGFMDSPLMKTLSHPAALLAASTLLQMKGQKDEKKAMDKANMQGSKDIQQIQDPNFRRRLAGPTYHQQRVSEIGPDGRMMHYTRAIPLYPGQPTPADIPMPNVPEPAPERYKKGGRVHLARGGGSGAPSREYGYNSSSSSDNPHSAENNAAMNSYLSGLDSGSSSSDNASGYGNANSPENRAAMNSYLSNLEGRPDRNNPLSGMMGAAAPLMGGVFGGPMGAMLGGLAGQFMRPSSGGEMAASALTNSFAPGMTSLVSEFGPSWDQVKDAFSGGVPFQKENYDYVKDDQRPHSYTASYGHGTNWDNQPQNEDYTANHNFTRGTPIRNFHHQRISDIGLDGQMRHYTRTHPVIQGRPTPADIPMPNVPEPAPERYKKGGRVDNGINYISNNNQDGYIAGPGKGQDDKVPKDVPEGSYIIDATSVSMFGDGSSRAGKEELDKTIHLIRKKIPTIAHKLSGGGVNGRRMIPAMLSDGEYEIDPLTVSAIGNGSNKTGAKILKSAVKSLRKHKNSNGDRLPPRAKDFISYLKGSM